LGVYALKDLAWRIAEYVYSKSFKDLSSQAIEEAKKRILDSLAVSLGALEAFPYRVSRELALKAVPRSRGSTVWWENAHSIPELATFANSVGVRYLDFNDTYLSKEAMHPSDMIPAVAAVAEDIGAGGKDLILGTIVAYEVATRLGDAFSVRGVGVDHVAYITIGAAAGVAKVMGLSLEKTYHAINIAVNESISLRQTRAGELSMWKGMTAGNSAKKGLFAALLASRGITGPSPVFEGEYGFFNVISKQPFNIEFGEGGRENILRTLIKYWPVEYHAMSAVEACLKIRDSIAPEEIEEVGVETFTVSYRIIAKDPEKWDPKTRETADHSLPYIVARALIDGHIWIDSFDEKKILGEDVRRVMKRMRIRVSEEFDKLYPEAVPNRVRVKLRDGRSIEETIIYPKGHYRNPMTRDDIVQKMVRLSRGTRYEDRVKEIAEKVWSLDNVADLRDLFAI
jgi:2-methylcitrate dehydratase